MFQTAELSPCKTYDFSIFEPGSDKPFATSNKRWSCDKALHEGELKDYQEFV